MSTTKVESKKAAIELARKYAMQPSERTMPERHLLLGELVMFIHELHPDKPKDGKAEQGV